MSNIATRACAKCATCATPLYVLLTCQMKKQQRRPICIEPLYRRSTISLIKSLAEHQKKKHSVSSILQSVCWWSLIVVRFWQQRFSSSPHSPQSYLHPIYIPNISFPCQHRCQSFNRYSAWLLESSPLKLVLLLP